MQSAAFQPPSHTYKNCLIRGLPIDRPFRIHYDVKDAGSQIGTFIILPLQINIQENDLLDLTGQIPSCESSLPEEGTDGGQTNMVDTIKKYLRISDECRKALTLGKSAVLSRYCSDNSNKSNEKKPGSSLEQECKAGLKTVDPPENSYNQDINSNESKVLMEGLDREEVAVLDPVNLKVDDERKGNHINVNDLTSVDDMEASDGDFSNSSGITPKPQDKSLSLTPVLDIKIETETSENDYLASNFAVVQTSNTSNRDFIKIELNDSCIPFEREETDLQVQETGFGIYGDTADEVNTIRSEFDQWNKSGQPYTYNSKNLKRRRSSKKVNVENISNKCTRKTRTQIVEDDAELQEIQKQKLVKIEEDDDITADVSCRRSSRLRSTGFRPDYLNVENKMDEFIAYAEGDNKVSDDEADRKDVDTEDHYLDDTVDDNEEIGPAKMRKKMKKYCIDSDFDPEEFVNKQKYSFINKDKANSTRASADLDDDAELDDSFSDCKNNTSGNKKAKKTKEKKLKKERVPFILGEHEDKYRIEAIDSIARMDRGKSDLERTMEVYVCNLCQKFKSESVEGISSHLENHINGKLTCKECGLYASNLGELFSHKTQMHKHLFSICPDCGKQVSERCFKNHLGLIHNKPQYECMYCQKNGEEMTKYLSIQHLHKHCKEIHKDMCYTCEKCERLFFRQDYCKLHEKSCKGWKETDYQPCEKCGKMLSSKTSLRVHMKTVHLKIRSFQCTECPYSAPNRHSLRHHQLVHEDRFLCTTCGKSFARKWNLKKHEKNVHEGNKGAFHCCRQYFKTRAQLTRHRLTNHEKSPTKFSCDQCSKDFVLKVDLTRHMRYHRKSFNFKCEVCDRMYDNQQRLDDHKSVHTGAPPSHRCTVCTKCFRFKSDLPRHMKTHKTQSI